MLSTMAEMEATHTEVVFSLEAAPCHSLTALYFRTRRAVAGVGQAEGAHFTHIAMVFRGAASVVEFIVWAASRSLILFCKPHPADLIAWGIIYSRVYMELLHSPSAI